MGQEEAELSSQQLTEAEFFQIDKFELTESNLETLPRTEKKFIFKSFFFLGVLWSFALNKNKKLRRVI